MNHSEPSPSSAESEPTTSDSNGLEGSRQWGSLRSTVSVKRPSPSASPASRSTETSSPSTLHRFLDGLTSYMEASRARTLVQQDLALALRANEALYGLSSRDAFAWLDRATRSWRTFRHSTNGDWTLFSGAWPKAGTMRNGIAYRRQVSGASGWMVKRCLQAMAETGCGPAPLFRIPPVSGSGSNGSGLEADGPATPYPISTNVKITVDMLPTPTVQDASGRKYTFDNGDHSKPRLSLPGRVQVLMFPTPKVGGMCGGTGSYQMLESLREQGLLTDLECSSMQAGNGGKLNPEFSELLIGLPTGWTDWNKLETQIRRRWSSSSAPWYERTRNEGGA